MFERLFALHSFVLTDSVVIVHGAGDIRLLFRLLLKFRNVLKHTLACNQNIKKDIPTALEVCLCFETKRNDIKFSTKTFTQRASNIRGRTGYNV